MLRIISQLPVIIYFTASDDYRACLADQGDCRKIVFDPSLTDGLGLTDLIVCRIDANVGKKRGKCAFTGDWWKRFRDESRVAPMAATR